MGIFFDHYFGERKADISMFEHFLSRNIFRQAWPGRVSFLEHEDGYHELEYSGTVDAGYITGRLFEYIAESMNGRLIDEGNGIEFPDRKLLTDHYDSRQCGIKSVDGEVKIHVCAERFRPPSLRDNVYDSEKHDLLFRHPREGKTMISLRVQADGFIPDQEEFISGFIDYLNTQNRDIRLAATDRLLMGYAMHKLLKSSEH
jgi:hypothetical protein